MTADYRGGPAGHVALSRGEKDVVLLRRFRETREVRIKAGGKVGLVPESVVRTKGGPTVSVAPPVSSVPAPSSGASPPRKTTFAAVPTVIVARNGAAASGAPVQKRSILKKPTGKVPIPDDDDDDGDGDGDTAGLRLPKNRVRAASVQFQTGAARVGVPLPHWDDQQVLGWLMEQVI